MHDTAFSLTTSISIYQKVQYIKLLSRGVCDEKQVKTFVNWISKFIFYHFVFQEKIAKFSSKMSIVIRVNLKSIMRHFQQTNWSNLKQSIIIFNKKIMKVIITLIMMWWVWISYSQHCDLLTFLYVRKI